MSQAARDPMRHWSQIFEWQVSQAKLTVDYSEPRLALSAQAVSKRKITDNGGKNQPTIV